MPISSSQIERAEALARQFGATRLVLFGSALEDPAHARDLDLACDGVPGWKLFELAARIEEEIRAPLDLVPLRPMTRFTRHILAHGKALL
jgi:predicted nucleotidyltransferase